MRTTDFFPSKFAKAADLMGKTLAVTIEKLAGEEIGQGQDRALKPILNFQETNVKPMVLNKTNFATLEDAFGDSNNWPGHQIELFSTKVPYKGDLVDGVRIRIPAERSADELVNAPLKPTRSDAAQAEDPRPEPPFDDSEPF